MKSSTKIALWTGGVVAAVVGLIWYEEKNAAASPAGSAGSGSGSAGSGSSGPSSGLPPPPTQTSVAMPPGVSGPYTTLGRGPWTMWPGHVYLVQAPYNIVDLPTFESNFLNAQFGPQVAGSLQVLGQFGTGQLPSGWPNSDLGPRIVFSFTSVNPSVSLLVPVVNLRGPAGMQVYVANGQTK